MLDAQDAAVIANKLHATIKVNKKGHDRAEIHYNGKWIASFGIRRASNKSTGHDHIPKSIHWTPHKCKECAKCKGGYDEWVRDMIAQGIIEEQA